MEKKLMRVTYTPPEFSDTQTVGRAQVLIPKSTGHFEVKTIRRKVKSIIATLGNVRYYEEKQDSIKGTLTAEELLDVAVKGIVDLEMSGDYVVAHIEVKIMDLDFYDYHELLE